MTALIWLVSSITNILNTIGILATCHVASEGDFELLLVPLIVSILGLVFGFATFSYNVAPRMFWVKSKVGIFDMRVGAAFGYALAFFNSAAEIVVLIEYVL